MMPLQRACVAESQVRNKLSNRKAEGAVKSVYLFTPSILQRAGIRKLPGICWYPAKRIGVIL